MRKKPNIFTSFIRYNTIAIIATAFDFGSFMLFNDVLNFWYVLSSFLGSLIGGITAFLLNRNWAFIAIDKKIKTQAIKYLMVWGGSITLNTYGLYLLVENSDLTEVISKMIVAVFVGVVYNFLMARFFVFK